AEVTMTGKGTRFQEWMPVFFTVNIQRIKSVADKVVLIVCIRNVRVKYQQKARIMNTGYEA
ncbi:hypothetical protein, partial [Escherichia coli]|uniref:hypothetical protein n=1 Tax=Escherichia coli TaxID=562 RepID=UPI001ADDCA6B